MGEDRSSRGTATSRKIEKGQTMADIADKSLSELGEKRIEWASRQMPVLRSVRLRFEKEKPLQGAKIAACLHVTTETANLMITLKAGGGDISLCAANPLSTQDDVAAALQVNHGIDVHARRGVDTKAYYSHIESVLDKRPHFTMDDGADLVTTLHTQRQQLLENIVGGTEETTTGVTRIRSMAEEGVLRYPVIAINNAMTKHLFDNRYGTGQSTIDGILRATNYLLAGSTFVVCGYGWCGRGVASRAAGMGAQVIVTEVNPLRALEAVMDGYQVMRLEDALPKGDIFCTVTGDIGVIREEHFALMKEGAILCNSGHFDVEIDVPALRAMAKSVRPMRKDIDEFTLKNGKKIYLLSEGRIVNLTSAEGHPPSVMDMSFSNQALSVEYLRHNHEKLTNKVYSVPEQIDKTIAKLKLQSMGIEIDHLTEAQKKYLSSWQAGT